MGCTGSKLAGDKFLDIDADATPNQSLHWNRHQTRPSDLAPSDNLQSLADPSAPPNDGAAKPDKSPNFGSHTYMGTLPFTGTRKTFEPKKKKKSFFMIPEDPMLSSRGLTGKTRPVQSVPEAGPSERMTSLSTATEEEYPARQGVDKPILRTDEDRKQPDPVTGKKPGLYQRFTNARLGVGEERDPVTGRGKYTGMTKEETIAYVRRTRGAGLYSKQPYSFVSAGEGIGAIGGGGG